MNDLVRPENMSGRNTSARRTNIESFGQLNKFHSGGIRTAQEYRHLKPDSRRTAPLSLFQVLPFPKTFDSHSVAP
jgi:hypothetical protein